MTATISKDTIGDRTYTANYTPITYTIEYELDGGTNDPENPAAYTIETNTITLQDPEREGYAFEYWTLENIMTEVIPTGSIGNRTFTANYTPIIYTISYDLDGGTNHAANPATYTIETATGR